MNLDVEPRSPSAFESLIRDFVDRAGPMLDVYEQVIYIYVLRHTLLEGRPEAVIAFKSARQRMARGVGTVNTKMAEGTLSEKLRSLATKGFLEVVQVEHKGTRVRIRTPEDVLGPAVFDEEASLPLISDYFTDPNGRQDLLRRESYRCFYCMATLTKDTFVVDHVTSRPSGDNSYTNCVAACRDCNNRKKALSAEDYLRQLFRERRLAVSEFEDRLTALDALRAGALVPHLGPTSE